MLRPLVNRGLNLLLTISNYVLGESKDTLGFSNMYVGWHSHPHSQGSTVKMLVNSVSFSSRLIESEEEVVGISDLWPVGQKYR